MTSDSLVQLANHLWQSTVFAVVVWLIALAFRNNRAAIRHALWLVASVKFLIPYSVLTALGTELQRLVSVPASPRVSALMETLSQPFGAAASVASGGAASSVAISANVAALLTVWIVGTVVSIVWWSIQWLRLHRMVAEATPVNLDFPIRVLEHRGRLEPGVFGIFKPVLLLPQGIGDRLSLEQLQAVLAHELCHVRRRDNLTATVHMFIETLFWFHPLLWWIRLRLIDEQERACDEEVLRLGGDPQVYAESILKVCECYLTAPSMYVSGITSSNLNKRIEEIMKNRTASRLNWGRTVFLAVAAIACLVGPAIFGGVRAGVAPTISPATPQGGPRGGDSAGLVGYRIIAIELKGFKVLSSGEIREALGLTPGQVYDESQLREGFENLRRLYGNLGYVDFVPQPAFEIDERRRLVTLTINVDEGPQYTVNRIRFFGNMTTPDEVLRREISVKEGAVFNVSLLEASLVKLNQLGLFEQIHLEDAQIDPLPNAPKLDVSLRVKEKTR